ncbi:hypothetical protein PPTG_21303 [Phytophthora nicotianae INRA-310]|uniref:Uncharacterized protein n=1 Tax=Phytophthora nicotianae (strain INRA-310) TaxID=761204 RepID=W2R5C9_PHYN3|nr:hypothetical protein PPTG_21303 [Phytophthora nicotianae INRA-310]ETN20451.1 hypothetical protein PPTG_21303 [Phytophthora nicotianae INRA-310]
MVHNLFVLRSVVISYCIRSSRNFLPTNRERVPGRLGGVDVHDQLCLMRYSIQRVDRFRKYYNPLVLGRIDLAIVNGYIVHKAYHKNRRLAL